MSNAVYSGTATGLPVDAKLQVEYSTSSDFGAVLISSSPIVREAFYYKAPFKDWMRANARSLLKGSLAEDIKKYGIFIVTQTHATQKCALTAWRSSESSVYFGFGVGAMGLAEIAPNVGWYSGRSESGWDVYEAERDELKVIFAGGLWFRKKLGSKVSSRPSPMRTITEILASTDTYARDKFT